jgi:adenylate cyclase
VIYQVLPSLRSESEAVLEAEEAARIAQENSVAVLPFIDLSPDADHAYLAAGLSDTVLHLLSQVRGLSVTARTSSFAFKDKGMDVAGIALALGVGNILEGSVQRAGDQVRIIARLIDARSGSERWSGNFDRELSGIFEIQDEIAREVVTAMKVTILDGEQDRLKERYRPNLEAYEQYVLGRSELLRESRRSSEAAELHSERSIELDANEPNWAIEPN